MRGFKLPGGREAIVSDTVGFISDLPTHLVEAFRATLEEVQQADLILHVRDVTHPETKAQRDAVLDILGDLGIEDSDERIIEVLNKVDQLPEDERAHMRDYAARATWEAKRAKPLHGLRAEAQGGMVAISALTGFGIPELVKLLSERLAASQEVYEISLDVTEGAALSWLYSHGRIVDKRETKTKIRLKVELSEADHGRFVSRFGV
jgi:GTP-binding protein HflX